jgi:hypothetical protein
MRLIVSRSGTATGWQLFPVILALILIAGRLLGDEPPKFVIFDNDFYGPASSDLQAAALLLTNPGAKVLRLTVVTGDGWRDEETAHMLRLLEILRREDVPVVQVILPSIFSHLVTGLRLAVGIAWIVLVPAEMLGVRAGLGYYIMDARDRLSYSELMAVILLSVP